MTLYGCSFVIRSRHKFTSMCLGFIKYFQLSSASLTLRHVKFLYARCLYLWGLVSTTLCFWLGVGFVVWFLFHFLVLFSFVLMQIFFSFFLYSFCIQYILRTVPLLPLISVPPPTLDLTQHHPSLVTLWKGGGFPGISSKHSLTSYKEEYNQILISRVDEVSQ